MEMTKEQLNEILLMRFTTLKQRELYSRRYKMTFEEAKKELMALLRGKKNIRVLQKSNIVFTTHMANIMWMHSTD